MMYYLTLATAMAVILSGIVVMHKGDWRKLGLKFAGVALSTLAAIWLLVAQLALHVSVFVCPQGMPDTSCLAFELYHILRNTAFICFHVAVGRDAIRFRKGDRRGDLCRTNSLSPLSHL